MSFSERNSILLRILAIEADVRKIEQGRDYLRIKRNLRVLQNTSNSGGMIVVSSPDDLDSKVELRKNSSDIGVYIEKYVEKLQVDRNRINSLNLEKNILKNRLFSADSPINENKLKK